MTLEQLETNEGGEEEKNEERKKEKRENIPSSLRDRMETKNKYLKQSRGVLGYCLSNTERGVVGQWEEQERAT